MMLREFSHKPIQVYLIWQSVLVRDDRASARQRFREFADPQFTHLWDRHRATGRLWQLTLGKRDIPWDIYFLYDANAQWENAPTVPDFSVHKLRGANIARLKSRLKRMLDRLQ